MMRCKITKHALDLLNLLEPYGKEHGMLIQDMGNLCSEIKTLWDLKFVHIQVDMISNTEEYQRILGTPAKITITNAGKEFLAEANKGVDYTPLFNHIITHKGKTGEQNVSAH